MVRSANRSYHCASGIAFAAYQLHVFQTHIDPYVDQLRYRYSLGIHMPRRKGAATFTEVIHTAYAQPD